MLVRHAGTTVSGEKIMMKIVWRNPNGNPNGIILDFRVLQISRSETGSGQVQIIYRKVTASKGPAADYEVLVNREESGYAGLGSSSDWRKTKRPAAKKRAVTWLNMRVDRIAE
jgi:hypothetical protein